MYKFTQTGLIDLDGVVFVPGCRNAFDNAYQDWLASGNTPLTYEQPPADRKAEIIAQISALDLKRIRPMVEGDTIFLGRLTMQIKALREELKNIG